MYKILGSDGNEYESISAEKIRQWIQESRVEKKTPVMPEGAEDWVFLEALPEFAESFASLQKPETAVLAPKRRRQMRMGLGLFLVVVVIAVLFILKKTKLH
jgi:hypothetical protein